jgi:T1SS-143 domain-containing protein
VIWTGNGTSGSPLVGTAGIAGPAVATVTIGTNGAYNFALSGPIDHPSGNGENTLSLNFGVLATAASGDTSSGSLVITVEDDSPVALPSSRDLDGTKTNVLVILDVSGSMDAQDGVNGTSRLASAIASINQLLNQYDTLASWQSGS